GRKFVLLCRIKLSQLQLIPCSDRVDRISLLLNLLLKILMIDLVAVVQYVTFFQPSLFDLHLQFRKNNVIVLNSSFHLVYNKYIFNIYHNIYDNKKNNIVIALTILQVKLFEN